jgi:hypothetical protein
MDKNKFFKFLMIFPVVAMLFTACKDEEESEPPSLSVNAADKSLSFEVAGGSKTIVVTANAAFTVAVESGKTWCTVSDITGALFKINVAANTETEARAAKVTVSLTGAPDVEINVSQAGVVLPPAVLLVTPRMFHFDTPAAAERIATVTTNRPTYTATVESGKTWLTTEINGEALKIKVAASAEEAEREASITVHVDGAEDVTLHVTQAAYVPPVVLPAATAKWNVAAPGNFAWYKWEANRTIGTPAGDAPSTVAGPGNVQAWALAKEDHIKVTNPLTSPTTAYTMLWDVRVANLSGYCALLQTKEDNDDGDADVFLNGRKVGLGGYSGDVLTNNTWHRIVAAVDAATEKKVYFYVDGQPVFTKDITSAGDIDRYTLQEIFWLFLDNDNEDYAIDCAGIALWDTTLSAGQVLSAGTAETPLN